MVKRKHQKRRLGMGVAIILSVLAIVSVIVLVRLFLGGSSHILTETTSNKNALSQQVTTTTTTTTTRFQEIRRQTTTQAPETTTSEETEKPQTDRTRLDETGNSGVEFETLDEASEYAEKMITNPKTLAELRKKGYSGYRIRSVRWSDNTVTYTIDWV